MLVQPVVEFVQKYVFLMRVIIAKISGANFFGVGTKLPKGL